MSIAAHFQKRTNELRMPASPDSTGIRYDGPILTGQKSVEQAQRDHQIRALTDPGPRILDGILGPAPQSLTSTIGPDPARHGILARTPRFPSK